MGGIKHFTGKLIPTGKDINEYMKEMDIQCSSKLKEKFFHETLYDEAVLINKKVFKIKRVNCYNEADVDEESIFDAKKNKDRTFSFEIKFHTGGTDFGEALGFALEKIK